jgi:hypothetical protein
MDRASRGEIAQGHWIGRGRGLRLDLGRSGVGRGLFQHADEARRRLGKMQLWASKKNENLGDERQTGLSTITLQTTSPASAISIYFNLHDEDDGRGGSNDESFLINEALGAYDNYRRFEFTVPPCSQNPEFEKTWCETISARDDGRGGSNEVFLDVKVHVWRLYP